VVEVVGRIGPYRGRRQLEVETIQRIASDLVVLRSLLPTVGPVEPYWSALDQWRGDIPAPIAIWSSRERCCTTLASSNPTRGRVASI
jgi:hypothetical protein